MSYIPGGGGGAPTTSTYVTQTPDAGLSAEQALSALASGYMKVTTTTGIVSSQVPPIPLADGGLHADISGSGPGALWQTSSGGDVTSVEPVIIRVKNISGSTANANEIGLVNYDVTNGFSYNTTMTANQEGMWCVVVVGGANNADILVARRGRVTVKLNANCSIGNFLLTSTTAGQASVSTTMRPEVFAIALTANAGGAGGTCVALLITQTRSYYLTNANDTVRINSLSSTNFVATINGTPSGTSVVYNAPSSGSDNTIVPTSSSQVGKIVLHNTTRGTDALISSVNTGTKTITLTATVPGGWASGDSITARSQTATGEIETGAGDYFFDLDLTGLSLPSTTRSAIFAFFHSDSTASSNAYSMIHPFQAVSGPFSVGLNVLAAANGMFAVATVLINILQTKMCFGLRSSGAATGTIIVRIREILVAEP